MIVCALLSLALHSHCESTIFFSPAAVVGLEETFYRVSEGVGFVEVCAIVYSPNGNLVCPIDFAFEVDFSTSDGNAGNDNLTRSFMSSFCSVYHGLWFCRHYSTICCMWETELCEYPHH